MKSKDNKIYTEIVSPEGVVFEGGADSVSLPTIQGEITVLPHHTNLFTGLGSGVAQVKQGNSFHNFGVRGGFLEIIDGSVRVISDFALRADSVTLARAEEAKRKAERAKKEAKEGQDYVEIEKDLQRAILELDVAHKMKRRTRN